MKTKNSTLLKILPGYFLIALLLGGVFSAYFLSQRFQGNANASFISDSANRISENLHVSGNPIYLSIPNLGIDLDVIAGNYSADNRSWNLSGSDAQYATVSSLPNNKEGTTIIYGHNTLNIFGKTGDLKTGDKLYLKTDNNHVFEYSYVSKKEVNPKDTDIFFNTGKPQAILITCSGLLDSKRRLMYFDLISTK